MGFPSSDAITQAELRRRLEALRTAAPEGLGAQLMSELTPVLTRWLALVRKARLVEPVASKPRQIPAGEIIAVMRDAGVAADPDYPDDDSAPVTLQWEADTEAEFWKTLALVDASRLASVQKPLVEFKAALTRAEKYRPEKLGPIKAKLAAENARIRAIASDDEKEGEGPVTPGPITQKERRQLQAQLAELDAIQDDLRKHLATLWDSTELRDWLALAAIADAATQEGFTEINEYPEVRTVPGSLAEFQKTVRELDGNVSRLIHRPTVDKAL